MIIPKIVNTIMERIVLLIVIIFAYLTVADLDEDNDFNCPQIVTKHEWGGRLAVRVQYQIIPVQNVIIHHTVTNSCKTELRCSAIVRSVQIYHMDLSEFADIGYNFLVGNDGRVYEGSGWHIQGAHTLGWNKKSIGIAFIGDFSSELPSHSAIDAAKNLIKCGVNMGEMAANYSLYGAKQLSATESPGIELYEEIKKWDHWTNETDSK